MEKKLTKEEIEKLKKAKQKKIDEKEEHGIGQIKNERQD